MKRVVVGIMSSLCFSFANIDALLDNIVLGSYSNPAGTIRSPNYSTFTGPSLGFRLNTSLINKPILSWQAPRVTLSCAGLDFDAGWLSMMNLDTLAQMLQQAGASFMWGVAIGLVYSLPGIAEAYDMLQKWGRYAQFLGMDACRIGLSLGKNIATSFRESSRTEATENLVATGKASTIEEALKKYKQNINTQKTFGIFPYEVYYSSLSNKDIADLIASFTGVLLFYPADAHGNICRRNECLDNIRVKYLPPLSEITIDKIIGSAGYVEVYDCSWGVLNIGGRSVMFCSNVSEGGLPTRRLRFSKGLADLEYDYLSNIVKKMESGTQLSSNDIRYLSTTPIQNLIKFLNYAKTLRTLGRAKESEELLRNLAYLSAGLKLRSFIYSVKYNINVFAGRHLSTKDVPEELFKYVTKLNKNIDDADKFIKEKLEYVTKVNRTLKDMEEGAKYLTILFSKQFGFGTSSFQNLR